MSSITRGTTVLRWVARESNPEPTDVPKARSEYGFDLALATGVALAAGLSIGAAVVGYETTPTQLAIMGALSGAAIGIVQGLLLRDRFSLWLAWMLAMPLLFAIAWVVTEAIGIDVADQFTVFGASGSVVFGVLSGLLMMAGKRTRDDVAM
jgi:hypothetical protein